MNVIITLIILILFSGGIKMPDSSKVFYIRGGGVTFDILKGLITPIIIGLAPGIFFSIKFFDIDFTNIIILFISLLLSLILIISIIFDIYAFFKLSLIIRNDGVIFGDGLFRKQKLKPLNLSEIQYIEFLSAVTTYVRLYKYTGNDDKLELLGEIRWFKTKNIQKLLQILQELNPKIEFDRYCKDILLLGKAGKYESPINRVTIPIILGLGCIIYIPQIEFFINKYIIKMDNWVYHNLQNMFYATLIPSAVVITILSYILTPRIMIFNQKKKNIFSNRKRMLKVPLTVMISFLIVLISLVWHILNYIDCFQNVDIYDNKTVIIKNIVQSKLSNYNIVKFYFKDSPKTIYSINIDNNRINEMEKDLESPVDIYITKNLNTILKISNKNLKDIYLKENDNDWSLF